LAKRHCRCDYALFLGGTESNSEEIPELAAMAAGLKLYLNDTYTTLKMNDISTWLKVRSSSQFLWDKKFESIFNIYLHEISVE